MNKLIFASKFYLKPGHITQIKSCPYCHGNNLKNYTKKREALVWVSLKQCQDCDFIFQSPRLSERGLEQYYKKDYRKMRRVPDFENNFSRELRKGQNYLNQIHPYISDFKNKKILEIGSARGGILKVFKDLGADVEGLEWDIACREFANKKGINTKVQFNELNNSKFDLIILSHVLEHVDDYSSFLEEITGVMNDDSLIFISVPGRKTFERSIQIAHLYYFTPESLKAICDKYFSDCLFINDNIDALYRREKSFE
ncbi:class I SAM-dependent methyltransferase [Bacteriovoracaceae bacterium]|nr:class I SAM-dependent methyltransferase [Bacteriovoracaceae bacterium]